MAVSEFNQVYYIIIIIIIIIIITSAAFGNTCFAERAEAQAHRQGGFHVARKPPPPPSIRIGGGAQTNFLRDELLRVSHRQIRRVDGTDTRINL